MNNLQLTFNVIILLVLGIGIIIYFKNSWQKQSSKDTEVEGVKTTVDNRLNEVSTSLNKFSQDITRDLAQTMQKVDSKVEVFNLKVEELSKSQQSLHQTMSGVKNYGTLGEYTLSQQLEDYLPASRYIPNVKIKPQETKEKVEFCIKFRNDILLPIDSHWPLEKFKAVTEAIKTENKKAIVDATAKLVKSFKDKAKEVEDKYIFPPKTTNFAYIYVPIKSMYDLLCSYHDPITKELLPRELFKKHKINIMGQNELSSVLQAYDMGFQTLKVQKHATEIYDDLRNITSRFIRHFSGIVELRKKLEEAMKETDKFGRDARTITRTLENIKDPEQIEKATKEENVEKVDFKDKTNVS
jgi:DNA recombination protein RmuC